MFTGLVQAVGVVREVARRPKGLRLAVDVGTWAYGRRARVGDSVSVAGVCLTVVGVKRIGGRSTDRSEQRSVARRGSEARVFEFDVVRETLDKTRLGLVRAGDRVNLEHAATASTLMGGHIVQGHVDGVGRVAKVQEGEDWRVWVELPRGEWSRYLVSKGSVCVEGVSLTVAGLTRRGFWVALIPATLEATTLGELGAGDAVNVEMDVIAKMVAAQMKKAKRSRG